jgi:type VI secretion system protein ImpE
MDANELFREGQLQPAIDAQLQAVRENPGDPDRRLFLFELAAFAGDLDRARKQIDLLKFDQPELEAAVQMYRGCLDAEQMRREVFAGKKLPAVLGDDSDQVAARLKALGELAAGRPAEAAKLLAENEPPSVTGTLNGHSCTGMRDGDDLLGDVLEVFGQGRYFWVPLGQIESLQANEPKFPRDLLWLPARLVTRAGPAGDVFLPTLYFGSHSHADDAIKLGRASDWSDPEAGPVRGIGAKTFLAGEDAIGLLEFRELVIG